MAGLTASKLSRGSHQWTWNLTTADPTGDPINPDLGSVAFADKTYHVSGDFGTGGQVIIEGSNDGTNYFALHNTHDQSAISGVTAAELEGILENPAYIRPRLTAGTSVAVTVIIVGRAIIQLF